MKKTAEEMRSAGAGCWRKMQTFALQLSSAQRLFLEAVSEVYTFSFWQFRYTCVNICMYRLGSCKCIAFTNPSVFHQLYWTLPRDLEDSNPHRWQNFFLNSWWHFPLTSSEPGDLSYAPNLPETIISYPKLLKQLESNVHFQAICAQTWMRAG